MYNKVKFPSLHLACKEANSVRTDLSTDIHFDNNYFYVTSYFYIIKGKISYLLDENIHGIHNLKNKSIHYLIWEELCKCHIVTFEKDKIIGKYKDISREYNYSSINKAKFIEERLNIIINKFESTTNIAFVQYDSKFLNTISNIIGERDNRLIIYPNKYPTGAGIIKSPLVYDMFAILMPILINDVPDYKQIIF